MKSILTVLGLLIFLHLFQVSHAQEPEDTAMIQFSSEYKFKDGLYLNIDDVRNNDPIPLGRVVTDLNKYNKDFFDEMIIKEEIILYDENGVRVSVPTKDIWGYAKNGRLYIMLGGKFQRLIIEGSISHFISSATTYVKTKIGPKDTVMYYTTTEDLYRSINRKYYYANVSTEGKMSLFDFESNILTNYNEDNLGKLLERDSIISSEYESLRKREKKKRMSEFIRRYNANHPLFFPKNNE
jgi:hypothetical protein